jgi:predicted nucleotidyltransferase
MVAFIDQFQTSIDHVCVRFGVKRLKAFGSVLRGDFNASRDDPEIESSITHARRMIGLRNLLAHG